MYYGLIGWIIWHCYWDIYVPKKVPYGFIRKKFRELRCYIIFRRGAMMMTSLAVVLGYFALFSRILDIGTACVTTVGFAILEVCWLIGIFVKNKLTRRRMLITKGPTPLVFIFYLIIGMLATGLFFSVAAYGANQLSFILIMLPTAGFCFIAYKGYNRFGKRSTI